MLMGFIFAKHMPVNLKALVRDQIINGVRTCVLLVYSYSGAWIPGGVARDARGILT